MGVALSLNSAQELKHISLRARVPPGPFYNFLSGRRCLHYQFRGDWFCCFTSFFSYEILNHGTYTHINIYFKEATRKNSENSLKILEKHGEKSSSNSLLPSNLPPPRAQDSLAFQGDGPCACNEHQYRQHSEKLMSGAILQLGSKQIYIYICILPLYTYNV